MADNRLLQHYARNLCRDLAGIAREYEHRLMHRLTQQGYIGLKPAYVQVFPYLVPEGARTVDLARQQGITKQAMGQLISELENLGYLERRPDPEDQRSRRITLTAQGQALVGEAIAAARELENAMGRGIGVKAFQQLSTALNQAFQAERLRFPGGQTHTGDTRGGVRAMMQAHQLARYYELALMQACQNAGYTDLKFSYGLVLAHLGTDGARIIDLARLHEISKQAVSQIAQELEDLGYIERRPDPDDQRARRLVLSKRGLRLIRDSVAAMESLEQRLGEAIGTKALQTLRREAGRLHQWLRSAPALTAEVDTPVDTGQTQALLDEWLGALFDTLQSRRLPHTDALFVCRDRQYRLSPAGLKALAAARIPRSASSRD